MSWKTDKDLGPKPWNFSPIFDKWAYLNNKRWTNKLDAVDFSNDLGLPIDDPNRHITCGHWHKRLPQTTGEISLGDHWWWQPCIDVYSGRIGLAPQYLNYEIGWDGFAALIYRVSSATWECWGYPKVYVLYAQPQSLHWSSSGYLAWYGLVWEYDWWGNPGDPEFNKAYGRLYVFNQTSDYYYSNPFPYNYSTGDPYDIVESPWFQNVMDCSGNTIVCLARATKKAGVPCNNVLARISYNAGRTFPTEFTFPNVTSSYDLARVRASEDGTFWVMFYTNAVVQIWKSNSGVTSFTKIWERSYAADTGGSAWNLAGFDVSDADGQYITIGLYSGANKFFYYSTNYGVAFTVVDQTVPMAGVSISCRMLVSTGEHTLIHSGAAPNDFYKSDDYCANFHGIDTGAAMYYPDTQKHYNEYVHTDCDWHFNADPDFQGLIYSTDYGENWTAIASPAQLNDGDEIVVPGGTVTLDEPQVWTP